MLENELPSLPLLSNGGVKHPEAFDDSERPSEVEGIVRVYRDHQQMMICEYSNLGPWDVVSGEYKGEEAVRLYTLHSYRLPLLLSLMIPLFLNLLISLANGNHSVTVNMVPLRISLFQRWTRRVLQWLLLIMGVSLIPLSILKWSGHWEILPGDQSWSVVYLLFGVLLLVFWGVSFFIDYRYPVTISSKKGRWYKVNGATESYLEKLPWWPGDQVANFMLDRVQYGIADVSEMMIPQVANQEMKAAFEDLEAEKQKKLDAGKDAGIQRLYVDGPDLLFSTDTDWGSLCIAKTEVTTQKVSVSELMSSNDLHDVEQWLKHQHGMREGEIHRWLAAPRIPLCSRAWPINHAQRLKMALLAVALVVLGLTIGIGGGIIASTFETSEDSNPVPIMIGLGIMVAGLSIAPWFSRMPLVKFELLRIDGDYLRINAGSDRYRSHLPSRGQVVELEKSRPEEV